MAEIDANAVKVICRELIDKIFNGGSKCKRGGEIETKMDSIQTELTEEKKDRKITDTDLFLKLDTVRSSNTKNTVIATFVLLAGIIVSIIVGG